MVWDGGSEPLVVPTRWTLLGVTLGGAPAGPSSGGVGFTEKSVVRRPPCYQNYQNFFVIREKSATITLCQEYLKLHQTVLHRIARASVLA